MRNDFRSSCPIASALDIIGDKWSLLLVRDMLIRGKKTFKEFSASSEHIAPGILSSRLKWLEENNLLTKRKLPDNRKENIYILTEKGIAFTPIIVELIFWSDKNLRAQNAEMPPITALGMNQSKSALVEGIQHKYQQMVKETLNQ